MGHPAEALEPRLGVAQAVAVPSVPRGLLVALLIGDRHLLASVAGFAVAAILVLQLS